MAKWLGPGVLRLKNAKNIKPGEEVSKTMFASEERYNTLLEKGYIEGVKARKTGDK